MDKLGYLHNGTLFSGKNKLATNTFNNMDGSPLVQHIMQNEKIQTQKDTLYMILFI